MKEHFLQKIKYTQAEVEDFLGQCRSANGKIVFTNGCFDLLHSGHLQYLQEAKSLGDLLIIGVNTDDSVQRLKGPKRPIRKLEERLEMLAALQMVDLVIPFSEDTPERLIHEIKPNILVKGGDYTLDQVVGAESVIKEGGEVQVLSFKDGVSTTDIIEEIIKKFA